MENTESLRKSLNKQQTELRRILTSYDQHDQAIQLLLSHHAMLHSAKMAQTDSWSFEDAVLNDLTEEQFRRIPRNDEHSIAWCIWHLARIEDVAMNLLVAGSPQIMHQDNWLERLKVTACDTGNEMNDEELANLSATIDIDALRAYRVVVGRRTQAIVKQLGPEALKKKVDPIRLQQVRDEGAVVDAAGWLLDYWGKRNHAGLLLMPATRHNLVHLNEALRLKRKRQ